MASEGGGACRKKDSKGKEKRNTLKSSKKMHKPIRTAEPADDAKTFGECVQRVQDLRNACPMQTAEKKHEDLNINRIDWDVPTKETGGAWEAEPYEVEAGPTQPRAATTLVDPQKPSEKVRLLIVWSWQMHLKFLVLLLCVLYGYFAHQKRVVFFLMQGRGTSADIQSIVASEQAWCGVSANW